MTETEQSETPESIVFGPPVSIGINTDERIALNRPQVDGQGDEHPKETLRRTTAAH